MSVIFLVSTSLVYLTPILNSGEISDRQSKQKKHIYPSHSHANTSLLWTVQVHSPGVSYSVHHFAASIASSLNLTCLGQVNNHPHQYTFVHNLDQSSQGNLELKHNIKSAHAHHVNTYTEEDMLLLVDKIETSLDRHPGIEWYSHQRILPRQKRWIAPDYDFMDFKDPAYHDQWHLVRITQCTCI